MESAHRVTILYARSVIPRIIYSFSNCFFADSHASTFAFVAFGNFKSSDSIVAATISETSHRETHL